MCSNMNDIIRSNQMYYFLMKTNNHRYFSAIFSLAISVINLLYYFLFHSQQNGQSSSESSDDLDRWLPVFVAITDRELR